MRYSPHEYQRYVIDYIKKNPVAAVFLDMGLGKTPRSRAVRPALSRQARLHVPDLRSDQAART